VGVVMIIDLLRNRCSVRKFMENEVPKDIVDSIIEAGRLSPSGGNEQPWKFGIITDKSLICRISEIAYNQSWIKSSPLLIVLCTTIVEDIRGGRDIQKYRFPKWSEEIDKMDKELYSSINLEEHQTKIPGTHMIMQALEYGISSTWISYFDVEKVSNLLNLPKLCIPSEIIAFGYSAEDIKLRPKKNAEELTFYNKTVI
jgi:nitroreductase